MISLRVVSGAFAAAAPEPSHATSADEWVGSYVRDEIDDRFRDAGIVRAFPRRNVCLEAVAAIPV